MKAVAVVFLHVDSYKKCCHYLIHCHRLVSIINISPNNVYMTNHPSFNFNFYNFDKDDIPHTELFFGKSLLFCSTCILHEGPKINFFFQIFYIIHIKKIVQTQPIMKGVMKG